MMELWERGISVMQKIPQEFGLSGCGKEDIFGNLGVVAGKTLHEIKI